MTALGLGTLSREELLQLVADEAWTNDRFRSRVSMAVAHHSQDLTLEGVLLSPDLLSHVVKSLEQRDFAAAATCSAWATGLAAELRRRPLISIDLSGRLDSGPWDVVEMPDGTLCVADTDNLRILTAQGNLMPDGGAWAALTKVELESPLKLELHEDAILVVEAADNIVRRLRLIDGETLARSPVLTCPHDMAIAGDRLIVPDGTRVSVLDVRTLEVRYSFNGGDTRFQKATTCAVRGDELYVADWHWSKRGQLRVFNFDGVYLRTVCGAFGTPCSIVIRDDRIYMVEQAERTGQSGRGVRAEVSTEIKMWAGRRVLVLELNGEIEQIKYVPNATEFERLALRFRGDALLLADAKSNPHGDDEKNTLHVIR